MYYITGDSKYPAVAIRLLDYINTLTLRPYPRATDPP